MKVIKNKNDSTCRRCGFSMTAVLVDGEAVCGRCGSDNLVDQIGHIFQPVFVQDLRRINRVMPINKERRQGMFV